MVEGPERIQQLGSRVRWLDRHRRHVAIATGLIAALIMLSQLSIDWPRVHAAALFVTSVFVVGAITEVVLAWMAALWETECDQLTRDRGLPRAIVRK